MSRRAGEKRFSDSPIPRLFDSKIKKIMSKTFVACILVILTLTQGCVETEPPPEPPSEASANRDVVVHLFEWKWTDVAQECETFLGPKGYKAVQVSPPTENAVVEEPMRPWWERYQPASYTLDNRSGNRAAFADMVARCKAAGVDIYVDAILNHMTGAYAGVGTAGTAFGLYDYPGLYSYDDFHHCGLTEGDEIQVWDDPVQVTTCELVNLTDLDTGAEKVQARLAEYLNDLRSLGVAGFRLDAARHVAAAEITAILDRVEGDPYVYQEVIDPDPPTWAEQYYPNGTVTEFRYSAVVSEVFYNGPLTRLHGAGSIWEEVGFLPSANAFVFIDNHDNQRGHGAGGHIVTHKDGDLYNLAVAFMLAYPYGRPRVMSSYAFEEDWQGPPADADYATRSVHNGDTVDCFGDTWQCEHRRPTIAGMVGFNNATASTVEVANWWTGSTNQIAFSRGDRGFIVINRDDAGLDTTLQTGLPAGTYCNVTEGDLTEDGQGCTGGTVSVGNDGMASVFVGPMQALAIHVGAKVGG